MRIPKLAPSVVTLALVLVGLAPAPAVAQDYYTATPTYQFSLRTWDSNLGTVGNDYRSWGIQLGMVRPGAFLSPHVWLQRYTQESLCPGNVQQPGGCDETGWSVSVGPALRLINRSPWWGEATADVDLGPGRGSGVDGGAGFRVGVHLGGFYPSVFTRFTRFRSMYYSTFGFGLRLELHPPGV